MKKVCMALALIAVILVLPAAAYAGDSTISESGTYDLSDYGNGSVITINAGLTVTVTNTAGTTYENMQIACGESVTLTLSGVKIDNTSYDNACPLSFTGNGNALMLEGDSILKAGQYQPGVKALYGTSLEISGGGTLDTAGGAGGAGLGGGVELGGVGAITIKGGTVTATGGYNAAGIGGSSSGSGGILTIEGGTVIASGGESGAGIGGGSSFREGDAITIKGGTVTAQGGRYGAGINGTGYGVAADKGCPITIEGGTVVACGGESGAGIGGGYTHRGGVITITGGVVTATGGAGGAGLGGGKSSDSQTIIIIDGQVNAAGGTGGAGIGGGEGGSGGASIKGGTVTAQGGTNGAGIGGGEGGGGGATIEGGTVTAQGGDGSAALGGGLNGSGGASIKGGMVTAQGGDGGAGIGSGENGESGTINISGGTVTATGGPHGAGIGGGYHCIGGGEITITGGTIGATGGAGGAGLGGGENGIGGGITAAGGQIHATGGENGAGIGGGYYGSGGWITIEEGTIEAQGGGGYGAGIGGGGYGSGGIITIKGGQTDAVGGQYSAGIGGGYYRDGGTITITGGVVTAAGGQYGAGIGGGYHGAGGTLTFSGGRIYAQKGADAPRDIGWGLNAWLAGSLNLPGDAAIFCKTGTCIYAGSASYKQETITSVTDDKVYGVPANGWEPPFGVYMAPYLLSYDANGGAGAVPASLRQHKNTTTIVASGEGLSHGGKAFVCWNTMSDGMGTNYSGGSEYTFTEDRALYAMYTQIGLKAESASYNSISLTWTAFPGASGYEIRRSRSENGSFTSIKTITGGSVLAFTDKPLIFRATYYYKVRAYWYEGGKKVYSDYSHIDSASPQLTGITGLKAVAYSPTKAKISWNAVPGRTKYELWAVVNDSSVNPYGPIASTTYPYYYLSNLRPFRTYSYWIRVYRLVGKEKVYHEGDIVYDGEDHQSHPGADAIVTTTLGDVANVTAAPEFAGNIKISWSGVKGVSGYEVHRWTEGGRPTLIKSTANTYHIDQNCIPNTTYYYYVRAYLVFHASRVYNLNLYWEPVQATPYLGPVTNLKAAGYGAAKIKLTWSGVSGRTGYEIYRAASADGEYTRIKSTTYTYYTDYDRIPNTAYYYKVLAYRTVSDVRYRSRELSAVAAVTATPYLGPVTGLKAAMNSASSIKVSWSAVSGRTGYEVYRSTEENGVYTRIKSTTYTYYIDNDRIPNTAYYYKVLAYRTVSGTRYRSQELAVVAAVTSTPYLGPVTNPKAVRYSATKIKLTWSAVSGRTGYEIYRAASADGEYTLIKSTTDAYYYNGYLTTGVTYYYKILAYRTVGGIRYRSQGLGDVTAVSATP